MNTAHLAALGLPELHRRADDLEDVIENCYSRSAVRAWEANLADCLAEIERREEGKEG